MGGRGLDRRQRSGRADVYRDKQLVIKRTFRPTGLRLVGAVDVHNVAAVQGVLSDSLNGHTEQEVHVDLTLLEFIDVSGIRAIVAAAESAADRHRLIVHGLPPLMQKVMDVVGWTEMPSLFVVDTAFPQTNDRGAAGRRLKQ